MIGQSFELVDPIVNGRGSIQIGDSIWRVEGPELPKGARITVVGADGTLLKVTAAGAVAGGGLAARLPPAGLRFFAGASAARLRLAFGTHHPRPAAIAAAISSTFTTSGGMSAVASALDHRASA